MLFQLRKENMKLNDEYNKMINEKARLEVEYLEMKKQHKDYEEEEEFENHEQFESLEIFIESVQNTSNSIVISSFIIFKK